MVSVLTLAGRWWRARRMRWHISDVSAFGCRDASLGSMERDAMSNVDEGLKAAVIVEKGASRMNVAWRARKAAV